MAPPKRKPDSLDKLCHCAYSHCVKRYCMCAANERICSKACTCYKCSNQNPSAFSTNKEGGEKKKIGCVCKTGKCVHVLCKCLKAGIGCTNRCRCEKCDNVYGKTWDISEMKSETSAKGTSIQ